MCLFSALQNKGHIRSSRHCCPEVQNWILYYIVVIPPPKGNKIAVVIAAVVLAQCLLLVHAYIFL